jgi:ribosomal protein S18 acetylase RimI-like enzyme
VTDICPVHNILLRKSDGMSAKLTYASLPVEIKKIANESLGLGVLKSLFNYSHTYHLMIKISDGAFIGFVLYHFHNTRLTGGKTYVTGVIDAVCVSTPYRREGFGTLLTFGALRKMSSYGVDRVEMILKTPNTNDRDDEPGVPLIGNEDLLYCLGFRKIKTYDNYYEQKSKKYNYDCLFCGNRPDTCKAILYAINDKDMSGNKA